ncbi:patatin-like phospholipase family protein, partial [Vibrio furnissii]
DWNTGYRDRVNRSQRRVRDKEYEDRYQLTTDLGVRLDGVYAPRGVVQGQNMLRILRETSGNLMPFQSFNDLVVPFRAVATDIIKLEPVVLDKGYLVDAMMASMSVPGALPPYEIDGRWLVDGGVTNNMPVDVARQMGADVVIAVDISTDYKSQEAFTNFLTVADQLSNYLVRRSTELQAETLTEDDVLLRPQVGLMETTEFDKMPDAFAK